MKINGSLVKYFLNTGASSAPYININISENNLASLDAQYIFAIFLRVMFCEHWMLPPRADQWPRSLKQQSRTTLMASLRVRTMCLHYVRLYKSEVTGLVSQTDNDMSPCSGDVHVLSHPENGRITAKPGMMDLSHATLSPSQPSDSHYTLDTRQRTSSGIFFS